jgi:hypothetical protein
MSFALFNSFAAHARLAGAKKTTSPKQSTRAPVRSAGVMGTCAGLGLKLRNLTPDYKFCSHVAFRGALGYGAHSAVGPIAAIRQSALELRVGPDSMRCSSCVPIRCSLIRPARSKCRSATLTSLQVGEAFLLRTTGTSLSMTVSGASFLALKMHDCTRERLARRQAPLL